MDKDVENLGAVPSEPVFRVGDKQDGLVSFILDVNDDLQDEIGMRREQFYSISKTCDDLYTRIGRVDVEMVTRTERNLKLAIIGMTMGMIGICASVTSMIL